MNTYIKIYLCQLNFHVGDLKNNYDKIISAREEVKRQGGDLCVFSELSVTGYPPEDLVLRKTFIESVENIIDNLIELSNDNGPGIIVGYPRLHDNKLMNSAAIIFNGNISIINKFHLPNYGVFDEKRVFNSDRVPGPIVFKDIRIGLMICEDMWYPDVSESLQESGAQILIVINGSPFDQNKEDERLSVAVSRVVETNLPLIYVNQIGGQDELVFDGSSFALDSSAKLCLQSSSWREEVNKLEITINNNGLNKLSSSVINKISVGLESKYNAMVLGLRDYVNKNRFKGVVLGLSGGIDSALAVAIAVDALGADRVRGIRMPSKYSSEGSLSDAKESAKLLNIKIDTINIEEINKSYLGHLNDLFKDLDKDTTEENIQSRIRGVILMAVSNKFGEMLISTGNKSEISVGYTTIYGDMNGGFCALKDAYKTDVYNLSKWRNNHYNDLFLGPSGMAIPANSITKEPSAELDFNQKDQDSLPDYEVLDEILIKIIEEEASLDSIISMGHDSELVHRVYRLLLLSEYKRRQSAPGVKLTARSFGKERRYPIVNAFLDDT
ncbi:MAG: NAD+ synthase [Pelagibacterales bacterium]|nr:NAD+ synthase [Pelagibacterales bacterium]PPR16574.1 MAG: Glutamine-dependent NAD(+) synthetase [Alphaproteobacteria bacterium MarineAlpha9_Bin3]